MPRQRTGLATLWDLGDVVTGGVRGLDALRTELRDEITRFEQRRTSLAGLDRQGLADALTAYSRAQELRVRINSFTQMLFAADTRNQEAKVLVDQSSDLWAETDNRTLFFRLWWMGLPDDRAAALKPESQDDAYFLDTLRRLKPYTLEEKVEQAINLKSTTGMWQWTHQYDSVTSSYTFTVNIRGKRGKPRKLVANEVIRLFAAPRAATRESAYVAYLSKYSGNGDMLGDVYRTVVRDWRNEYVKMRGYHSPISARNVENEVTDEAVSTLLAECKKNARVFQDFFALKARLLGLKRLSRYHIYAPLSKKERKVSFAEGVDQVGRAFESFDHRFASLFRRTFEEEHVDVYPRVGKRSGAYCMSVTPQMVPYIMLNFAGSPRDVYTIAHESGHAIHSQLASGHTLLTFQPTLVLAETASVFGEMILFDDMMGTERDREVKRAVLLDKISGMYGTIGRQAHFVIFEIEAHEAVDHGATVDDIGSIYLRNLRQQFGNGIAVPDEFRWEWVAIPHIYHTPFYCYAYAFGNLLTLALYQRYRKEGKDFVSSYMRLLSHGGSESPKDILAEVGVDIESAAFWDA
ncbi:MAG TPA: M3 family oligoendopeptidase, partial [Nitrososphaerales archaeon]|nr:M3 family oligoendopeptidase [Nitrososphaerales archaeon]